VRGRLGSLRRDKLGRALARLRAVPADNRIATGGSGGMTYILLVSSEWVFLPFFLAAAADWLLPRADHFSGALVEDPQFVRVEPDPP
jgi:hypothetical protein